MAAGWVGGIGFVPALTGYKYCRCRENLYNQGRSSQFGSTASQPAIPCCLGFLFIMVPFVALITAAAAFTAPYSIVHQSQRAAAISMAAEEANKVKEPEATWPGAKFYDEPSQDPQMSCFMVPSWLESSGEGYKWVCAPSSSILPDSTHADDSY